MAEDSTIQHKTGLFGDDMLRPSPTTGHNGCLKNDDALSE